MAMMNAKKASSLVPANTNQKDNENKFNVNKKINIDISKVDDEDNLLGDLVEEDEFEDLDNLVVEDGVGGDDYLII
jgi:hypothetical protein